MSGSETNPQSVPKQAEPALAEPTPAEAAPAFTAAAQPAYAQTLFLDSDGLRPGWGLAFYLIVYFSLRELTSELPWDRMFGFHPLRWVLVDEALRFVAAALPAVVLARVERRPWWVYGLPGRLVFGKLFWVGALWGFGAISLLVVGLYGAHAFAFGNVVLHGGQIAKFGAFWAATFLAVGLFEEFCFRGYTQFTLARGLGFWPSAAVLSVGFGLVHIGNGGEAWPGLLAAGCIGFFFCLTLRRTGNLWFAVGFHAAWDWGESFFYSVPDSGTRVDGHLLSATTLPGREWLSGGSVGPEGSVLCFVVIALAWVVFDRVYPKDRNRTADTAAE